MNNYSKKKENYKLNTFLYIRFKDDISSSFGNELPYPHKHYINSDTNFVYCWLLDGYFNTNKNYEFLNDIVARMQITFQTEFSAKIKQFKINENQTKSLTPLKLKEFQNLKSIVKKVKSYTSTDYVECEDQVFWSLKLFSEDCIKENGIIIYSVLEDFAFQNFIDKTKDKSTLKSKCKSIWNWYFERDFEITLKYKKKYNTKEELEKLKMTRIENAKKLSKVKEEKNYKKVINIITGMFSEEYRKPNGKYNATLIGKNLKMDPQTVRKHLKKYLENENKK